MSEFMLGTRSRIAEGSIVAWKTIFGECRGRVRALRSDGSARIEIWTPSAGKWSPSNRTQDIPMPSLRPVLSARASIAPTGTIEARANSSGAGTELFLYGDVFPGGGIDARSVSEALRGKDQTQSLSIFLSSPGGSPFEGVAIASILSRWKGRKKLFVDGLAASAATIIACASDTAYISPDASYMIHRAWTVALGSREEMQHTLGVLDMVDNQMAEIYSRRTGIKSKDILDMMSAETWMDATEAKRLGFVDDVVNPPKRNAGGTSAMLERPWFARCNAPAAAPSLPPLPVCSPSSPEVGVAAAEAAATPSPEGETGQETSAPPA